MKQEKIIWEESSTFDASLYKVVYDPISSNEGTSFRVCSPVVTVKHDEVKDLEALKLDVKKLMLKNWTKTEVDKLGEFMEDVIIATMVVNKLPVQIKY